MDLNIIFFMGVHDGLDYFTSRFVEYTKNLSVNSYIVDVRKPETYFCADFYRFVSLENVVVFTFNNVGLLLRDNENLQGRQTESVCQHADDRTCCPAHPKGKSRG